MSARTLYDKLWDAHVVRYLSDDTALIYIDRHLIHEVTSPQAFEGLELAGRNIWRKNSLKAVSDHNVPTVNLNQISDPIAKTQLRTLDQNCEKHRLTHFKMGDAEQGIVHVSGPEQGWCLPGMTIVCGDSHTATNGALAAMAFGIGTSEIEHVMATQCLVQQKAKNMRINLINQLPNGVTAKDLILHVISVIGTAGATGYAIEYTGSAIEKLTMEERMTVCNMSIEAGGRIGLVAFDAITSQYVKGKPFSPRGDEWESAVSQWKGLASDPNSEFEKEIEFDTSKIEPQVSWGTSPEMVVGISGQVPDPKEADVKSKMVGMENALKYMDLVPGQKIEDIGIDKVFIGSCTNSRIEDLRSACEIIKGRKKSDDVQIAMVVPGSGLVKRQAEAEGLDKIFLEAGFEWREPGCSMCLGMNDDQLNSGERCASTSNRNFEGRQGRGGRTHLVSPAMAAAAAITGHFIDYRKL
tara:strand:- start:1448 stop:2848 length:1401 start_codon:yes stop_codon:yes gene_type:complete